jgi:hypothetical protein
MDGVINDTPQSNFPGVMSACFILHCDWTTRVGIASDIVADIRGRWSFISGALPMLMLLMMHGDQNQISLPNLLETTISNVVGC